MSKQTLREAAQAALALVNDTLLERAVDTKRLSAVGRDLEDALAAEPAQPFCYLKQTSSSENPPHGWAVHFTEGDVALYTSPQPPADVPRLTLEDIWSVAAGCTIGGVLPADKLARAVEAEVLRRMGVVE